MTWPLVPEGRPPGPGFLSREKYASVRKYLDPDDQAWVVQIDLPAPSSLDTPPHFALDLR